MFKDIREADARISSDPCTVVGLDRGRYFKKNSKSAALLALKVLLAYQIDPTSQITIFFLFESKRLPPAGIISDGPDLAELCFKQPLDTASEEDIRAV